MKPIPEWNKAALLRMPCFAPLHPVLACLETDCFPSLQDCNTLLAAHRPTIAVQRGLPLSLVPQHYGRLPFEAQYEPRCYLKGEEQTRENKWNDLPHELMRPTFPYSK